MQWRRAVVWVLFMQIVCAGWGWAAMYQVSCSQIRPRFVQPDVLEVGLHISEESGGFVGFYNTSDEAFRVLLSVKRRGRVSYIHKSFAMSPGFLWTPGKALLFTVAPDGTVTDHSERDRNGPGMVRMAFPDKGLFLQESSFSNPLNPVEYMLRDKQDGDIVERCELPAGDLRSVSPGFGQGRNYFLIAGNTLDESTKDWESAKDLSPDEWHAMAQQGRMPVQYRASLFSIKPLQQVARGVFSSYTRYNTMEYIYDEESSDLIAVLQDILRKYHFVRVRHTPENKEQAFQVEEFASIEMASAATWRNGLIYTSGVIGNGIGVTIEKRASGTEPKCVLVPFRQNARDQCRPEDKQFVVNGDGTLLCVFSESVVNGGCAFELWKVDFPDVTCLGEYIMHFGTGAKNPKITRHKKID